MVLLDIEINAASLKEKNNYLLNKLVNGKLPAKLRFCFSIYDLEGGNPKNDFCSVILHSVYEKSPGSDSRDSSSDHQIQTLKNKKAILSLQQFIEREEIWNDLYEGFYKQTTYKKNYDKIAFGRTIYIKVY